MTVSADYKRKIYAIRDLPTLPIIAQKILGLNDEDEKLAEKLGSIISKDQSLSVKVLTLANSAYYGHRAQVGTIKKAVIIIGTAMLRQFSLSVLFSKGLGTGTPEREAFWRHSLLSANAAAIIARRARIPNNELCFMGGLLHDVGKLVLDTNMHTEYKQVTMMVKNENWNLIEAERHIFDTDHTEIGAWMAGRWNLPPELVQSIGFHHAEDIAALPHARIVAAVHAASVCADAVETLNEESTEPPQVQVPPFIEAMLGITQVQFGEIAKELHNRRAEIQLAFT